MLSLGTMQNMRNQSVAVLWHYTIIVVTPELKTDFSYIKTLIFDLFFKWFLMPLILQTLSLPVRNPNMLLWSIALFQFHYELY